MQDAVLSVRASVGSPGDAVCGVMQDVGSGITNVVLLIPC